MRSSSKPLQALPLVRARDDLPDDELAIACASHHDTPEQVAAVRALLARAEATEDDLELGPQEGRPPELVHNNCSGNHAGMLALCRARGWPTQGYRLPEHPVQQACLAVHAEAAEVEPETLATGTDGCGDRHVRAHARADGARLLAARIATPAARGWQPRCGRGRISSAAPTAPTTSSCAARPAGSRRAAPRDCSAQPARTGSGVALKTEDGASRAHAPALAAFLGRLGVDLPDLAARPVLNTRGEQVGELVTALLTSSLRIAEP